MIVVTGSTGLVGSHLLLNLLEENTHIRAIIRSKNSIDKFRKVRNYYTESTIEPEWYISNLLDYDNLYHGIDGADQVYHCAAQVSFKNSEKKALFETNVLGTRNIVNLCLEHKVEKLSYTSSIAAIGKQPNTEIITENEKWPEKPTSEYARTKTMAELEVWRGIEEGLKAVIVNPSIILGPSNWHDGSSKFISNIYKNSLFYTLGKTGFVDVRDVARAMIMLMNSDISGERFILNSANLSYKEVFNLIAESLGVKKPRFYASRPITGLAWRISALLSMFGINNNGLTKQSARAAHAIQLYSSEKIVDRLGYKYIPIEETISHSAQCFLKDLRV